MATVLGISLFVVLIEFVLLLYLRERLLQAMKVIEKLEFRVRFPNLDRRQNFPIRRIGGKVVPLKMEIVK